MNNSIRGVALIALLAMLGVRISGCDLPDFKDVIPIPAPVVEGELFLVIIHEVEEPVEGLGNLRRNLPWIDGLKDREIRLIIYDDDLPEANPYVNILNGRGIVLQDSTGAVITKMPLPDKITSTVLDEILEKVGK